MIQIEKNNNLYMKVINHEDLIKNEIIIKNVDGDGNCYYRVVPLFIFGVKNYFNLIRQYLYKFIVDKKDEILALSPVVDYFGKLYEIDSYINLIRLNFFYAGDLEVSQTTKCFKINLAVYKYDNKDDNYK